MARVARVKRSRLLEGRVGVTLETGSGGTECDWAGWAREEEDEEADFALSLCSGSSSWPGWYFGSGMDSADVPLLLCALFQ